jgi:hypothetical protein
VGGTLRVTVGVEFQLREIEIESWQREVDIECWVVFDNELFTRAALR